MDIRISEMQLKLYLLVFLPGRGDTMIVKVFSQDEARPLHFRGADSCDFPKCRKLDYIIGSGGGL